MVAKHSVAHMILNGAGLSQKLAPNTQMNVYPVTVNQAAIGIQFQECKFQSVHNDLNAGNGDYWIDGLYFGGMRYCAIVEDYPSQALNRLREYVDTDEELYSDNECNLRAQAILDYMKDPAEHLVVKSSVIDYGTTLILAGDKVHVELPNENIDQDFRVISAEYFVDGQTQELEITLELSREAVLLADYMYALKSKINKVNRLKVAS